MWKKITCDYFLSKIFSYISEKALLNIIAHNKDLQKKLDKSLINYTKLFTGKYITHETNGKAKIYSAYNDELIIECEYLNGKRNGKFKRYYSDGTLRSEIEYLNGKINGEYKKYDEYGNLIEKCEYLNGEANGTGINYYEQCKYQMVTEFINGKIMNVSYNDGKSERINELHDGNGVIKEVNKEGNIIYECNYVNGRFRNMKYYYNSGKIKMEEEEYLDKGITIEKIKEYYKNGQIKSDKEYLSDILWNFKEYDKNNNIINNLKEGKGHIKKYYIDGELIFEGDYLNGEKNGKGKEYYKGELIFEGEYLYDQRIRGKEYFKNFLEFEGEYLYNKKFDGKGFDKYGNVMYELKKGCGEVIEFNEERKVIFIGEYLNGKRNGKGREYNDYGGVKFEGQYLNGKRNGKGKEYDYLGNLIYEGEYINGERKKREKRKYN